MFDWSKVEFIEEKPSFDAMYSLFKHTEEVQGKIRQLHESIDTVQSSLDLMQAIENFHEEAKKILTVTD